MKNSLPFVFAILSLLVGLCFSKELQKFEEPGGHSAIQVGDFDPAAFSEWVDGEEKLLSGERREEMAEWVIWSDQTKPGHSGLKFGSSKSPGLRHLRVGFQKEIEVGSVFVNGGGRLSVLKPGADYPGDLGNEDDWIVAGRLLEGELSQAEVVRESLAVWTLPPGTRTRALRFSHEADATDPALEGELGSALVTRERWSDLASLALAGAGSRQEDAGRLNDGLANRFQTWSNLNDREKVPDGAPKVSGEDSEWVMLTWVEKVQIGGLNLIDAGFRAGEWQCYVGPEERHPRDSSEEDWRSLGTYEGFDPGYPIPLWPNLLMLTEEVTTRAVRFRITEANSGGHPHIVNNDRERRRVWLGEVMALRLLGDEELASPGLARGDEEEHAPIAVRFHLEKAGFVTLVIEDEAGMRVRNLISETPYPAGDNVAWWDGTDDLGRDEDAARHGVYHIPARFVEPGKYRVRGLVRDEIVPRYEFPIYSEGEPAWETADKSGGWLTNHTPPQAALIVPAERSPSGEEMVYLGSAISEGGAGLAWVNLEGRKIGGRGWIGGNWTAAPFLAHDSGAKADAKIYAYVGATWTSSTDNRDMTHGELRITGLSVEGDKAILKYPFTPPPSDGGDHHWMEQLGGLAARDGVIAASLNKLGFVLLVDAVSGVVTGKVPVESPRGLAFDENGDLLVLSHGQLVRIDFKSGTESARVVIGMGLEDPHGLVLGREGMIFVSEHGESHQVKVFSAEGELVQVIGKAGRPKAGGYDELHMNHPVGMALDSKGRLWVTENDYLPKRVSVWNADGTLWRAFYGPAKYGGGGTLDPNDRSRFYYADENRGAMEFELDWEKGESRLARVIYRKDDGVLSLPDRMAAPEVVLSVNGRRYFTNCYNSNPTGGSSAMVFVEREGIVRAAAGLGRASSWEVLRGEEYAGLMPEGCDWERNPPFFLWSDGNDDGHVQKDEVVLHAGQVGGVTVMPDLSLCVARIGERAMKFPPVGFSKEGSPLYDYSKGEVLAEGVKPPASSGGDQILSGEDGWTPVTLGVGPFDRHSLSGLKDGKARWSYPSVWPGLHAGHEAPAPDRAGQLIATTRLLGGFVKPGNSDAGQLWAVNANMGTVYLFTADGLFVATVFNDKRLGKPWRMPSPERNMNLKDLSIGEENFWPTWSQAADGKVYMMNGAAASLIRLDGLESIRRLPGGSLEVTTDDLVKAQSFLVASEARRQKNQGRGVLEILVGKEAPSVDGKVDDWAGASWVDIDKSGVAANFDSNSKPYDITGALKVAGDRLYAAFRTNDEKLLENSGEVPNAPFKTGGCLDLMLGVNAEADPNRSVPVEGDLRLLVTMVKGQVQAVLYRAVVAGTGEPVPFSSPWRTIALDQVVDVSGEVQLAGAEGNYEFSIPLAVLGLEARADQSLRGDLGILRGNGTATTARVYWSNKATGITSDVPSEAMLTPMLWGRVEIRNGE